MDYPRQVSRLLDEEHRASLALIGRVEDALARVPRGREGSDPGLARLVGAFARHLEQDINRHFVLEEQALFTRMAEHGETDIADLLREEHDAIRAVASDLLPRAGAAAAGRLDDAGWRALRRDVGEMVERLVAHIQKETMALLPLVEDLLDEDADREVAFAYAAAA